MRVGEREGEWVRRNAFVREIETPKNVLKKSLISGKEGECGVCSRKKEREGERERWSCLFTGSMGERDIV